MEQFLAEVRTYAEARGLMPTTVIQRAAGASGNAWGRWEAGETAPTLKTVDKVRAYMAANPPKASEAEDAA